MPGLISRAAAAFEPAPPALVDAAEDDIARIRLASLLALRHAAHALDLRPGHLRAPGSGPYLSAFRGRGMEFDEVRPYMQGDDARVLDWRVTARTGRPHTKLFREERERAVLLWIDLRRPMLFATRGAYKAVRAAQAAALVGWSALHRGDRLGAMLLSENAHVELRPGRGQPALLQIFHRLVDHPAWQSAALRYAAADGAQALQQSLVRLRRVAQPGSLIVLFSDFSELADPGRAHLAQLARHNQLVLVDIHDPLEAEWPPPGRYRVGDGAGFMTLPTADPLLRARYRERFLHAQAERAEFCRRHGMTLLPLSTAAAPLDTLKQWFGRRA